MDRKKDSKFELSFLDKNNKTIKLDQTPLVKLWMVMKSGHGHGSEDLKLSWSENVYQIENVWFEMLGQWKIKIQLMRSGKESKGEIPICVMRDSTKGHVGSCL
jgi:hypothetical protein